MIVVLHWINLERLFRCHQTFKNDDRFRHYYLCEKALGSIAEKEGVYEGDPRDLGFLQSVLEEIKPEIVICANLIDKQYMEMVRTHCRYFVYIDHAVWSDEIIKQKEIDNKKFKLVEQYSIFDKLYVLQKEADLWLRLGMDREKICEVRGITFLDTVLIQDQQANKRDFLEEDQDENVLENPIEKNEDELDNNGDDESSSEEEDPEQETKTILLIHNSSSSGCKFPDGASKNNYDNSQDYEAMLEELVDLVEEREKNGEKIIIICKIGRRRDTLVETVRIKELHGHRSVKVVWPESGELMAQFLFADVILIQGFSTAYVEALLEHHRVVSVYLRGKVLLDQTKYPNLPVITERDQIIPMTNQMLEKEALDTDQANEVVEMIRETFGAYPIENVSQKIIEDLKEIFQGVP